MPPVDPERPSAERSNPGVADAAASAPVRGGEYTLPDRDTARDGEVADVGSVGSVGTGVSEGVGSVGTGAGVGVGSVGTVVGVGVGDGRDGKDGKVGSADGKVGSADGKVGSADGKVKDGLSSSCSILSIDLLKSWKVARSELMLDCSAAICPTVSKAEVAEDACISCATRVDSASALSVSARRFFASSTFFSRGARSNSTRSWSLATWSPLRT